MSQKWLKVCKNCVLGQIIVIFEGFSGPLNLLQIQKKILRLFFRYIGTTMSLVAVKKKLHAELGQAKEYTY